MEGDLEIVIVALVVEGGIAVADYSSELADLVESYLNSHRWKYDFDTDEGVFALGFNLSIRLATLNLRIRIRRSSIICLAFPPIRVDPQHLAAAEEYITRANYGMMHGCFEMDHSDGEVRFRSSLYCGDEIPSMDIVEFIVGLPHQMWNRYGDGLLAILFAEGSPEEEIRKAELSM
jgi:hypothetical protein